MKKMILAAMAALAIGMPAYSFDLKDVLGNLGTAASGVVEGLLTQSDITVAQMAGTWTATGSAVTFQSENALKKAGGSAVSKTLENKINPYYQKLGLTGAVLTINKDGAFSLKVKGVTLSGTVTKRQDGNFDFKFKALNKVNIGTLKGYVEKPLGGLNVMFDASKLITLVQGIAKITGNSTANSISSLLGSYDGLCVGFAFKQ